MKLPLSTHLMISAVIAFTLTGFSYWLGSQQGWLTELSWLEVASVVTAYATVYLCVVQTRWNYPINVISSGLYAWLMWRQGLYASALLNAYLVPVLAYGFWRWKPDIDTRPVTSLRPDKWFVGYIALTVAISVTMIIVLRWFGEDPNLAPTDTVILTLSILAQLLLDNKKAETWIVWGMVNVLAIYTYSTGGLPLVAVQYVFFLINAVWGHIQWARSMQAVRISEAANA